MKCWIVALVSALAALALGTEVQAHPIPGDANDDNVVNLLDLGVVGDNWKGTGKGWEEGDFTGDSKVDLLDLGVVGDNWTVTYTKGTAPVPEPTTLIIWSLLGGLGVAVGWYRRRKPA